MGMRINIYAIAEKFAGLVKGGCRFPSKIHGFTRPGELARFPVPGVIFFLLRRS